MKFTEEQVKDKLLEYLDYEGACDEGVGHLKSGIENKLSLEHIFNTASPTHRLWFLQTLGLGCTGCVRVSPLFESLHSKARAKFREITGCDLIHSSEWTSAYYDDLWPNQRVREEFDAWLREQQPPWPVIHDRMLSAIYK